MSDKTVIVLHNAPSAESGPDDLDTLAQAEAVEKACRRNGHEVIRMGLNDSLVSTMNFIANLKPDVVFNLVEHIEGSDFNAAKIPMMLGAYGLNYTGAHSFTVRAAGDKLRTKVRLVENGLPTPARHPLGPGEYRPGRWIIKSVQEHASKGLDAGSVIYAETPEGLEEAMADLGRNGKEWFAEKFIEGREFNLSILENGADPVVLPPAEIQFLNFDNRPKIVDYEAKWVPESHGFNHTPRNFEFTEDDSELLATLKKYAVECWHAFGMRGYCRVDFRVDDTGRPFIIDINANPCLSPDAGFAASAERHGLDYDRLISTILDNAV